MPANVTVSPRVKRNQRNMLLVLILILFALGGLFLAMRQIAKQKQAEHAHSFYEYVVTHHLGTLQELDDGTGLDPNSYMLTLAKPVANEQVEPLAKDLMYLYVTYDHGYTLTIFSPAAKSAKPTEIAQAHYDDDNGVLTMTLFPQSAQTKKLVEHVNW